MDFEEIPVYFLFNFLFLPCYLIRIFVLFSSSSVWNTEFSGSHCAKIRWEFFSFFVMSPESKRKYLVKCKKDVPDHFLTISSMVQSFSFSGSAFEISYVYGKPLRPNLIFLATKFLASTMIKTSNLIFWIQRVLP